MFKRLEKWLWLRSNKKPPRKYEAYLSTVGMWFLIGMIFILGVTILSLLSKEDILSRITASAVFLLLMVYMVWGSIRDDKRKGKYDAMHKASVDYWHKKRQKYGVEKTEEVK